MAILLLVLIHHRSRISQEHFENGIPQFAVTSFKLPLPLHTIALPRTDDDPRTINELEYLSELTLHATPEQKRDAKKYERAVFRYFVKFATKHGLEFNQDELLTLAKDTQALSFALKKYFGRTRPMILGTQKKIPIRGLPSYWQSSSYPSYPTLLAKVLANELSRKNPDYRSILSNLAKKVELSRLYGGYNYPTDNRVALEIASILRESRTN